jgi:hypothetical protein
MKQTVAALVALGLGLATGWVDVHSDEVQTAVIMIIVFAGLVVLVFPVRPWLTAVLVGAGIPLAHLFARSRGITPAYPVGSEVYWLPLVPALLAAYAAVALRKTLPVGINVLR